MEDALRAGGLRLTRQRRLILEYLTSIDSHPSARQLFAWAGQRDPSLSLATVYNTLGILVQLGLLKLIEFESLDNRYDINTTPHINLICTVCGEIQDWEEYVTAPLDSIREKSGFEVLDHRLEYYGFCQACKDRMKDREGRDR